MFHVKHRPTPWPFLHGGDELDRYAQWLSGPGVERGLIGPRETDRIWDRHILNCAVVEALVAPGSVVVDVGSGAGLPGLVLALVRPDLMVHLVEPMIRRTEFLSEVIEDIGVGDRLEVHRARAQDVVGSVSGDVVTARAVMSLDRLVPLCAPLVRPGGVILALKGARAADELRSARSALERHGFFHPQILTLGEGIVAPPTTVVSLAGTIP